MRPGRLFDLRIAFLDLRVALLQRALLLRFLVLATLQIGLLRFLRHLVLALGVVLLLDGRLLPVFVLTFFKLLANSNFKIIFGKL